jgi:hypothetical protein
MTNPWRKRQDVAKTKHGEGEEEQKNKVSLLDILFMP